MSQCELCKNHHDLSYGSGRFCSQKCARAFSTSKDKEKIYKKVSRALSSIRRCKTCGLKLRGSALYVRHRKEFHPKIFSLETTNTPGRRKYLIKIRGRRCEDCKFEKWKSIDIPLQVHHIDGNPGNNVESNLQLLCPNCHALTDTFCGKNVANKEKTVRYRKRLSRS